MYAALASAGVSQLYDLYKSVTGSSSSSRTTNSSFDTSTSDASSSSTDATSTGAVNSGSAGGSSFSDALRKLFVDLQANTSATSSTAASASGTVASTDPTSTIADDLKSAFKNSKASGPHGHHASPSSTVSGSNHFQGLASSLLAYAKTQSLTSTASTSLSA